MLLISISPSSLLFYKRSDCVTHCTRVWMPLPLSPKTLNSPISHGYGIRVLQSNSLSKPKPKPCWLTHFPLNRTFACTSSTRGLEITVPRPSLHSNSNLKHVDVATLSNLCVDIVLNVPRLPPPSPLLRKAFMDQLAQSPPDKVCVL